MSTWRIVAVVAALVAPGCGSSLQAGARADAGDGPPAEASPAADVVGAPMRNPACGGTVQTTGVASGDSFDASYVRVRFVGGDCAPRLVVTIAATDRVDSDSLEITLAPDPSTGSFVTHSTPVVTFQQGTSSPVQTGADFEVTACPDVAALGNAPTTDPVVGTFSIDVPGLAVSGSFSSPACQADICI
jgi:hypothetical protein